MDEFIFIEPERDVLWETGDTEKEYQRQYERWLEKRRAANRGKDQNDV